jgi:hypothetical protein
MAGGIGDQGRAGGDQYDRGIGFWAISPKLWPFSAAPPGRERPNAIPGGSRPRLISGWPSGPIQRRPNPARYPHLRRSGSPGLLRGRLQGAGYGGGFRAGQSSGDRIPRAILTSGGQGPLACYATICRARATAAVFGLANPAATESRVLSSLQEVRVPSPARPPCTGRGLRRRSSGWPIQRRPNPACYPHFGRSGSPRLLRGHLQGAGYGSGFRAGQSSGDRIPRAILTSGGQGPLAC